MGLADSFQHNFCMNRGSDNSKRGGDKCPATGLLVPWEFLGGRRIYGPDDSDMPSVEPLDNKPNKIDIDQRLASVLGHETTTALAAKPISRKLMQKTSPPKWSLKCCATGTHPVKDLLLNRPKHQLTEQEKEEVPQIQKQSKINFISDKNVAYFVQQKGTEQEHQLQYETNDWSYSVNTKKYKQTLLYSFFIVDVIVSLQYYSVHIFLVLYNMQWDCISIQNFSMNPVNQSFLFNQYLLLNCLFHSN